MTIIEWAIKKNEKFLGVSLDYLRFIAKTSLPLFWKFGKILSFSNCRKAAPANDFHLATILATKHEDCGTCLQIAINLAKKDGASLEVIKAAAEMKPDSLSRNLQKTYAFALACLTPEGPSTKMREEILTHLGPKALVEISMGIAAARVFPTVKRSLGFAVSCSKVENYF
jgi:hypothetical protein